MKTIESYVERGDIPQAIRLPRDSREMAQLQAKLAEYHERLRDYGEYAHPGFILDTTMRRGNDSVLNDMLKARLLGEVLEKGEIASLDFAQRMVEDPLFADAAQLNPGMVAAAIVNATGVISVYCGQGFGVIEGGTGLPDPT